MQHFPQQQKNKPKQANSPQTRTEKQNQTEIDKPEIVNKQQRNWSEQDILHLQRTVCNHATPHMLKKQTAVTPVIQRAETGMRRGASLGRFSSAALKLMTDNPNMDPTDFVRDVHKLAGDELTATGAPPTILAFGGSGAGSFNRGTWTI